MLSGQVSGRKFVCIGQALICLCQKSQDLPPLQEVTAKACLLALSWGHSHPGHPHAVFLKADGASPGGAAGWQFCLGRTSCPARAFAGQPGGSSQRSNPWSTPSITKLPHNFHVMEESNVSKDSVIISFILF